MHQVLSILTESLTITSFIFGMMLFIEYFTVQTKDKFTKIISHNKWIQILIGTVLGIIPGCLGSFLGVTLYIHNSLSFPALTAMMIATSGDEAFVMLKVIPDKFLLINGILFIVALATGFILNLFYSNKTTYISKGNFMLKTHISDPNCYCYDSSQIINNFRQLTIYRAILSLAIILLIILEILGLIGPEKWYFKYSLIIIFAFALFVIITVPEHFLKKHIWQHILVHHLARIFLWILGILIVLRFLLPYLDISEQLLYELAQKYYWLVLLLAVLVGILPESGPHLIFIMLMVNGIVPLSIVVANSISQDGHGSLPLLAESGKSFIIMKSINIFVALIVGVFLHFLGL